MGKGGNKPTVFSNGVTFVLFFVTGTENKRVCSDFAVAAATP